MEEIDILKLILVFIIGFFGVSVAHFAIFFYDFYSAGAIQEQFTPEKIQELLQSEVKDNELSEIRAEAGSQGGINRSNASRMKELDSILGSAMTASIDPTIKAAVSAIFPDFEGWIERNPHLAEQGLNRLQPFLDKILQSAGQGGNSGQGKSGGWG